MPRKSAQVYQLKITILDVKPPIWRRVQVPDCTLEVLHEVIQTCMDWTNSHLHEFAAGDKRYGPPDPEGMMELDGDEERVKLSQLAAHGIKKFTYTYDLGDSWRHEILIEKQVAAKPGGQYPCCTAGKRSGPPEDCGGAHGYANLLQALKDPSHAEHEELTEWVPADFDSEACDLDYINDELSILA